MRDYKRELGRAIMGAFHCEYPFLEEPKIAWVESDGQVVYDYFTEEGARAYDTLLNLLYDLINIGVIEMGLCDANSDRICITETLDDIVAEREG